MSYSEFFRNHIKKFKTGPNNQLTGLCPFHDDKHPSFSANITSGLWVCHGCGEKGNVHQFSSRLNVNSPIEVPKAALTEIARYTYENEKGEPSYQVRRYEPKTFRQFCRSKDGMWSPGLQGVSPILYRLPEVRSSDRVYGFEGEKDADRARSLGLISTTNSGGAGKWKDEHSNSLRDKEFILCPDQDVVGKKHGMQIACSCWGKAKNIKIIDLPKKDFSEFIDAGGSKEDFLALVHSTPWLTEKDIEVFNIELGKLPDKTDNNIDWPELIPINHVDQIPELSSDCMPPHLDKIISHIKKCQQVSVEMPLSISLAVIATAIGSKAIIELPSHSEPSPIWTCTVSPPGTRKSATFSLLLKPLTEIEKDKTKKWEADWRLWRAKADLADQVIRDGKRQGTKVTGEGRFKIMNDICDAHADIQAEPKRPHIWTEDTTSECLRRLMSENLSIGVFSAEGGSVFEGFGRYSGAKGPDMSIWLGGHAGDPGKATRLSSVIINDKQLLSTCLMVQPDVIETVGKDRMLCGRGFIDRFAFFYPPDNRGLRSYEVLEKIDSNILNEWQNIIIKIYDSPSFISHPLNLSSQKLWQKFASEVESRQAIGGDLRSISGWASKLAGLCGRIALAYHYFRPDSIPLEITEESLTPAINLCRALIDHSKSVFGLMIEDKDLQMCRHILDIIKLKKLTEIKARDICRMGWAGCSNTLNASRILKKLTEQGYLKEVSITKSDIGRPESHLFLVRPNLIN